MKKRRMIASLVALCTLLGFAGCGVTGRTMGKMDGTWMGDVLFSQPDALKLVLVGGPDMNLAPDGNQPLSAVVRVYQLRAAGAFEAAGADDLWRNDKTLLGDDLLDVRELVVTPGKEISDVSQLKAQTRYVAVAGFFRKPQGQHWRLLFKADDIRHDTIWRPSKGFRIGLGESRLVALSGKPYQVDAQTGQ